MFNAFDKMFDMLSQYLEKFFKKQVLLVGSGAATTHRPPNIKFSLKYFNIS